MLGWVGEADYGRGRVSLNFHPSAKSRLTLVHLPLVKGFTRPQVKTAFQVGGNVLMTHPSFTLIHLQGLGFGSWRRLSALLGLDRRSI